MSVVDVGASFGAYALAMTRAAGTCERRDALRRVPGENTAMGTEELKLLIGAQQPLAGWKNFDVEPSPGVDCVGDCTGLGRFASDSAAEIYASRVLEHLAYVDRLPRAFAEFHRVLDAEGRLLVSLNLIAFK